MAKDDEGTPICKLMGIIDDGPTRRATELVIKYGEENFLDTEEQDYITSLGF